MAPILYRAFHAHPYGILDGLRTSFSRIFIFPVSQIFWRLYSNIQRMLISPKPPQTSQEETRREGIQPQVQRPPVRRALLIGINYGQSESPLKLSHADTKQFKDVLIRTFNYREEDVILMIDDDSHPSKLIPTMDNICERLKELVEGAREGDHFIFYYAGHGFQEKSDDPNSTEEDGMDECILTSDQGVIYDDYLYKALVTPLPVGSSLVAIFDCCHAGTMLDLPHGRCNSAWKWKQRRLTRRLPRRRLAEVREGFSPWSGKIYQTCHVSPTEVVSNCMSIDSTPSPQSFTRPPSAIAGPSSSGSTLRIKGRTMSKPPPSPLAVSFTPTPPMSPTSPLQTNFKTKRNSKGKAKAVIKTKVRPKRDRTGSGDIRPQLAIDTALDEIQGLWSGEHAHGRDGDNSSPFLRTTSPEPIHYTCIGDCPDSPTPRPTVVSISSCMDAQIAYESNMGAFFTRALITVLEANREPTFTQLIHGISSNLQHMTTEMTTFTKEDAPPQVPWLSSLKKLNMNDVLKI
ncbi:hypothetical protein JAAARDRAFT_38487 [Jaapia argillacea MUCL 33604]|uniref:Peptidase C14 caspase domain-containing protein n=1 Tax=Jaapia argillacea MUCL 33604 TaxID=933084 RepID=A0A067PHD4_9AGAM|nr:hypothetical protein JAAARDRAFT_38487 [Jaapia argillacea MUCL 33604]